MRVRLEQFDLTRDNFCGEVEVVLRGRMQDAGETDLLYSSAMLRREVQIAPSEYKISNLLWGWSDSKLKIKKVIFNNPATIVYWDDDTRTVVKCQDGDVYDKEKGLALCYMKKIIGNKSGNFNKTLKEWLK